VHLEVLLGIQEQRSQQFESPELLCLSPKLAQLLKNREFAVSESKDVVRYCEVL